MAPAETRARKPGALTAMPSPGYFGGHEVAMDHSNCSSNRAAGAALPSSCLEQAASPAAARLPTNCRLFIAHTAREVKNSR